MHQQKLRHTHKQMGRERKLYRTDKGQRLCGETKLRKTYKQKLRHTQNRCKEANKRAEAEVITHVQGKVTLHVHTRTYKSVERFTRAVEVGALPHAQRKITLHAQVSG